MKINFRQRLEILNKWRMKKISNRNFLIILAFVVGIIGGIAASVLKGMTHFIASALQDDVEWHYKYSFYLVFPLIGILLSVLYIRKFLKGKNFEHGITPIIYSISRKSSRIEPHNVYSQIITSAVTVGFGGSSGLEAPIAYSGSAIGSNVGRFFGLQYREITMLLACGAAAGISGAFNSPVAGMIFAIEILLPEFSIPAFIPLLISSALASVISRLLYSEPLFHTATSDWEFKALFFYVIMSVLVGLYTVYFAKISAIIKSWFSKIKNPYNKVWFSGISLGVMIFIFPALYGEGYLTIQQLLDGRFDSIVKNSLFSSYKDIGWVVVAYTVLTLFGKSFAALFTLNGGGNGGVFGPSLVMGGLLGFAFAYGMNLTGLVTLNIPNFVMAGMAAALAGIMHAPLTSIFLIAEITGGYTLMVPLMLVASIAYLINRAILKHSIYTKVLADSGDLVSYEDKDRSVLSMMKLRYVLETNFVILRPGETPNERKHDIIHSKRNIFPIVDEKGKFLGILYIEHLLSILLGEEEGIDKDFGTLVQKPNDIIKGDENMEIVMSKMNKEDVWILPVVDKEDHYLGFVSKSSVFNKYRALLMRQGHYLE
ncbi:H(+)/Cl(-) exchange transporter ClcA [Sphingobacterium spiritivorum]|uniref:Chloride transporter, ClC family n=2 Tax=Sphingobacterium spiritivorum TaxID=258 RepID=D7VRT9_SPHSI|nr:chloride transporter, ClC family [Sphingobacterium spiritivorum ATCC 33861]QQT35444.1 chloride channel protein [Sphingobacterium spiritivorum]SUJ05854.1 H(+)/Cl(-) exchange transporter ClcA [Sphingobacterium spiritivorum]